MIIVDAHEDLAWSILTYGRDYTRSVRETRRLELANGVSKVAGEALIGWPEWQTGRVGIVFSTLFASPERQRENEHEKIFYRDIREANRLYSQQLDLYHRLADERPDYFRLIQSCQDLEAVLADWERQPLSPDQSLQHAVGCVVLMEGAEGIRAIGELEEWWQRGVRLIGPAWVSNRFCGGTHEPGPLTAAGFELLDGMANLGFGLDLSHMDEKAALQALDYYEGTIISSHANPLGMLKGADSNRHLSDTIIHKLIERDGVIGIVLLNSFLLTGWQQPDRRDLVPLERIVAHIDYICQLAGDARHVGIGSDFDGGFGRQSVPAGIDSVADLHKLSPLLEAKGYTSEDIVGILGKNWIERLQRLLPGSV